jgi:ATP-dependent Lon protease
MQGIHIHCPEGSVPKDGPSAGTAITTAIYSLLNDKKIKNTIAITGEITLMGNVTAIGGLDLKILGGIKAGIKEFIYPTENSEDFRRFMDKNQDNPDLEGISFYAVDHIDEVFKLVFV